MSEPNSHPAERFSRRWIATITLVGVLLTAVALAFVLRDQIWPANAGPTPTSTAGVTVDPAAAGPAMCSPSSEGDVASGWGDARPLFEDNTYPDYLVFNSTRNNENLGDERNWVRIRPADAGADFADRVEAKPDQVYEVMAYVRLDGPADQVASGTTLTFNVPTCTGHLIGISGFLKSLDAFPIEIWDGAELWAREDFNLAFVADSAVVWNNFGQFPLSDAILTAGGVPIGVEAMDGNYKPGYGNAAYVYFSVKPQFAAQ